VCGSPPVGLHVLEVHGPGERGQHLDRPIRVLEHAQVVGGVHVDPERRAVDRGDQLGELVGQQVGVVLHGQHQPEVDRVLGGFGEQREHRAAMGGHNRPAGWPDPRRRCA
jgi:hypothetical protein